MNVTRRIARRVLPAALRKAIRRVLPPTSRGAAAGELDGLVQKAMEEYVLKSPEDQHAQAAVTFDRTRFVTSLRWLSRMGLKRKRVLELGGYSIASNVLRKAFPDNDWVSDGFELRETFPHPDASFDLLLSMETIEHVCDIQYQHATTLSGVRHCLSESLRVLKPGGRMFLTTPNAAAVFVIQRALRQEPPWLYEYHFREFTYKEMCGLVEEAGFRIVEGATEQVWHFWDFEPILAFMRTNSYPTENRGDDTFLIAEKPGPNSKRRKSA